ncbi:flagellar hook-length control protein FliK [Castellaniella sp. GW247-6E4]|uniref:flagellar hook-length control protein FliK n=1 Tax=Castellaniella sp. GW247-6E4 TaxID=3140380 RepID=UPI0033152BEF
MSIGGSSTLGTLLIQRLDAVLGTTLGQQANLVSGARPAAVTQPGNPENPDALRNSAQRHPREAVDAAGAQGRGQAAVGKAAGATALDDRIGRAATYSSTTASAPTTLGFAARIILALLAQYPQADPAVQGRQPLLNGPAARAGAMPPLPAGMADAATAAARGPAAMPVPGAAGPQAPAGPFAAWAALATALDQPGALAARLSQALSQAVQGSGLFYESHLAALAFGKADARDLAREPQARLGAQTAEGRVPGGQAPHTQTGGRAPDSQATNTPSAGSQGAPPLPAQAPGPQGVPQGLPAAAEASGAPAQTGQAGGSAAAPAVQAPPIPGIDPQAQFLVRQQLEVLAHQGFAWQGEAWPGADMRWEVRRHAGDEGDGGGSRAEHWSTRLNLSLPALGAIQARLTLAGDQLVMRLAAPDSAERLDGAIETLRARLLAHGLRASQIAVVDRDDSDEDAPPAGPAPASRGTHDDIHPA